MPAAIQGAARIILGLEAPLLAFITFAFWYPTPTRTDWLWTLLLLIPVMLARYVLHQRFLSRTPLDALFLAFLLLEILNVYLAPYTRGLLMLGRPLLGMALFYAIVVQARRSGRMRGPNAAAAMLALLLGLLAIGSTQWNEKAEFFQPVLDALPQLTGFPGAEGGFNANEIAGALAWMIPLVAGLLVIRWRQDRQRWDMILSFTLMLAALILGQSRSAIVAVLFVLILLVPFYLSKPLWRIAAWTGLGMLVLLQLSLMTDLLDRRWLVVEAPPTAETGQTDSTASVPPERVATTVLGESAALRSEIWGSALAIIADHPLTGVGLNMFRDGRVRAQYPVTSVEGILPHAHNEILQIGADMGLPGLLVYGGIYLMAAYMLWAIVQRGDALARVQGFAAAGGLLAHALYGMTDAITLWDRFAFVFWILLGLLAAQYVLLRDQSAAA